jgi:ribosomal protein S18 acetylase RimI-like enzyme
MPADGWLGTARVESARVVPSLPYDTDGIGYAVCGRSDVPELIGLLSRTFAAHDPPAMAVGLTPEELAAYLETVTRTAADDGLTIVARDLESGKLAGVLLTMDAAVDQGPMDGLSPKLEPIMDIFDQLYALVVPSAPPVPGEALNLLMLGVADGFARRGIAQELVRRCLTNGARHGYRRAVTTATNPVSRHIFGKLGFTTLGVASYADYRRDGVAVFASIADQGGPMAMEREITA